ncbi:MAG: hypothetical protein GF330_07280, partial [Candidatus Eisenbacteria bacterium]|nr:hypothetical protein [Candidatus Eisenbacteria bacterium]
MGRRQLCLLLVAVAVRQLATPAGAISLREAYDRAGPAHGYGKYLELETGEVYTGGLLIGPILSPISWRLEGPPGCDVRIVGNGAILDLQG